MTGAEIIALITGLFQFPKEILALINAMKSAPAEKQAKIRETLNRQFDDFENGGRPTWD